MSKIYRHSYVYRPTEIQAFINIEKENKILSEYGVNIHFTEFEKKTYALDLYIKKEIIPKALALNKREPDKYRVPNALHEIASVTNHTPDYIQRVLGDIDDKIWLRTRINLDPILPVVKSFDFEKMFRLSERLEKNKKWNI